MAGALVAIRQPGRRGAGAESVVFGHGPVGGQSDVCGRASVPGTACRRDRARLGLPREPGGDDQESLAAGGSQPGGRTTAIPLLHAGAHGGRGLGNRGGGDAVVSAFGGGAARGRAGGASLCLGAALVAQSRRRGRGGFFHGDGGRNFVFAAVHG